MTTMERPHLRVCQGADCGASCTSRSHLGDLPGMPPAQREQPRHAGPASTTGRRSRRSPRCGIGRSAALPCLRRAW